MKASGNVLELRAPLPIPSATSSSDHSGWVDGLTMQSSPMKVKISWMEQEYSTVEVVRGRLFADNADESIQ
jgi:hypothetical protein